MTAARRLGIVCDLSIESGAGHLMRSAALAEEFIRNGWTVSFACDTSGVAIAASRLQTLGAHSTAVHSNRSAYLQWFEQGRFDAVLVDSYELNPVVSEVLTSRVTTFAFIDGSARGQSAHIYVDQNYGAQNLQWPRTDTPSTQANRLAGVRYTAVRDDVVSLRESAPISTGARRRGTNTTGGLQVTVVMGGTDPRHLTPPIAEQLAATGIALDVSLVTAQLTQQELDTLVLPLANSASSYRAITPNPNIAELLASSDAVISATGSITWELCCLGTPLAGVAVTDNQQPTYRGLVADGIVAGLGDVSAYSPDKIAAGGILDDDSLRAFLTDLKLRNELAARGYDLVDGLGKHRIYQAVTAIL